MHIARLLSEHAKLRALGADLVALVSSGEPCDLAELARRRWDLARMVHLHLAYEQRHLFARLENDPRNEVHLASAKAKRAVEQLHISYKSHVERWTAEEVVKRWPEFQAAVKTMVARMICKINREESDLFPLVASDAEGDRSWRPGMKNWAGEGVALQQYISGASNSVEFAAVTRPPVLGA
jgi:hypothetical protein